jgi:quercetin dioxygenase-like cupin family protein
MSGEETPDGVVEGEGYAVAPNLGVLGDGPGMRKVRRALGVTAFGVNVVVLPPGYTTNFHLHDEQEELYLVLSGEIEIEFGDGTTHRLETGGMARVDPSTARRLRNVGEGESAYFCAGGKDGYVGRDGRVPESSD